jgi:hypothetical protein
MHVTYKFTAKTRQQRRRRTMHPIDWIPSDHQFIRYFMCSFLKNRNWRECDERNWQKVTKKTGSARRINCTETWLKISFPKRQHTFLSSDLGNCEREKNLTASGPVSLPSASVHSRTTFRETFLTARTIVNERRWTWACCTMTHSGCMKSVETHELEGTASERKSIFLHPMHF